MTAPAPYVLGTTAAETARLTAQAEGYAAAAARLLDAIGVQAGWKAVDIGCGPLGILPLLAERVGSGGEVVGVEPEASFAAAARQALAARGLQRVRVVCGQASDPTLPRGGFDLVHERLVLMVAHDKARLLGELVGLARPGGVVAAEDFDTSASTCEPPHPAWSRLDDAAHAAYRLRGLDRQFGRRVPALLGAAGLLDVQVRVEPRLTRAGDGTQAPLLGIIAGLRPVILEAGILSAATLDALVAALCEHLARPGVMVVHPLLFQAWGRRPA